MGFSRKLQLAIIGGKLAAIAAVMLMCGLHCCLVDADQEPVRPISSVLTYGKRHHGMITSHELHHRRRLATMIDEPPIILSYHNGPIMSTRPFLPVYMIWYGSFSALQLSTVREFFSSFCAERQDHPSVKTWWNMTAAYKDDTGSCVTESLKIEGELYDRTCSKGPSLTNDDVEALVVSSLRTFGPANPNAMYLVLTADNVSIEDFCMNSCASHFSTRPQADTKGHQLPYIWVGNSATQCPGECAWPFARPDYGPTDSPLTPPNGDIGVDGMIMNLAAMLAGSATNPFNNGFYQGDASEPLEAATACAGMYGAGAYPGFPGKLMIDIRTGASFNVRGINRREFLVPALWNPITLACTPP